MIFTESLHKSPYTRLHKILSQGSFKKQQLASHKAFFLKACVTGIYARVLQKWLVYRLGCYLKACVGVVLLKRPWYLFLKPSRFSTPLE